MLMHLLSRLLSSSEIASAPEGTTTDKLVHTLSGIHFMLDVCTLDGPMLVRLLFYVDNDWGWNG